VALEPSSVSTAVVLLMLVLQQCAVMGPRDACLTWQDDHRPAFLACCWPADCHVCCWCHPCVGMTGTQLIVILIILIAGFTKVRLAG
jgi:hypothetical protein